MVSCRGVLDPHLEEKNEGGMLIKKVEREGNKAKSGPKGYLECKRECLLV